MCVQRNTIILCSSLLRIIFTCIVLPVLRAGLICSAAKSLDLLRQNIQKDIGRELNAIVQKYVDVSLWSICVHMCVCFVVIVSCM